MTTASPTQSSASANATQAIIDRHDQYMIHNVSRYPIAMVRGAGSKLWDATGREYLDLFAGFGGSILGHCHPDLVKAVTEQANQLWHVGNLFHTEAQTRIAEAISKHGFGGQSFFSHCGSDANEAAIKLARLYGKAHPVHANSPAGTSATKTSGGHGRYKIITAIHSFHGRLFGSMMLTGQDKVRKGFDPLLSGFGYVPFNNLAAVDQAIDDQTIAIMVEPIQGEGGVILPQPGYLAGLRKLCDERNMLLIFDEVWTGCGRTGKYFAHQHWNVEPDIMTLAKGVGGGLAVGVLCAKPKVAHYFSPAGNHGIAAHVTTLGGNCIAMHAAATIFNVIERDKLLDHASAIGKHAIDRLTKFAQSHPQIKDVRGKGCFIGIELNPKADGAWFKHATDVNNRCMEHGVLVNATQDTVLRLAPALTISIAEMDRALDVIEKSITG